VLISHQPLLYPIINIPLWISNKIPTVDGRVLGQAAAAIGFTADCESVEFYEHATGTAWLGVER
jgi:hypothetical protein